MKRRIVLPGIEPLSVNAMYTRGYNGVIKSSAAREWSQRLFHMLDAAEPKQALAELRARFDELKHCYKVAITYVYPPEVLFTKKGTLSAKCVDAGNGDKILIDCLFLPKYHLEAPPYGCENLNADDKFIIELTSRKAAGERAIIIDLELIALPVQPT